ncbi:hypothetical protein JW710_01780 [Candidatus Dojkabacteria bacterium]|nr:hypothetical protein [Candidatus Dojkabacteria bacterium]
MVMQIMTGDSDFPNEARMADHEGSLRVSSIGTNFEHYSSGLLASGEVPVRVLERGDIPPALLATNEYMDTGKVLPDGCNPDGFVYGTGAGNVLGTLMLFDDVLPKAILSVDILPDAVLLGRATIALIRASDGYDDFIGKISSPSIFGTAVESVIDEETSEKLKKLFSEVDVGSLSSDVSFAIEHVPDTGVVGRQRGRDVISVFAVIREKWAQIKQLSDEQNIGFGFSDFFEQKVLSYVASLTDFSMRTNIIYTSNLADYLAWKKFKDSLEQLNREGNVFLLASRENDFNLVATQGVSSNPPQGLFLE